MGASPRLVMVGGGVRSGKSRFALRRAQELGARRLFIATAQPRDAEMRARAVAHQAERGDAFRTVEEPYAVADVLAAATDADVVVVDCLTLWLSNLLLRGHEQDDSHDGAPGGDAVLAQLDHLCEVLARRRLHVVLVTNEVGLGIVPESALGRRFRDLAGLTHQRIAPLCDELYLGAMGVLLRLRPGPVALADTDLADTDLADATQTGGLDG